MKVFHKGLLLITFPLILQLVFNAILLSVFLSVQAVNAEQIRISKLRAQLFEVIMRSHGKMALLSELSIRPLSEPDDLWKDRKFAKIRMPSDLKNLVKTETEIAVLKNLSAEVDKFNLVIDGFFDLRQKNVHMADGDRFGLVTLMEIHLHELAACLAPLSQDKSREDRESQQQRSILMDRLKTWIAIVVIANFLLAWLLTGIFSRDFIRRIRHLKENSLRLAEGQELLPSLIGSDEIAELDRIFHEVGTISRKSLLREKVMFDSTADLICCVNGAGEIERVNKVWSIALGHDIGCTAGEPISSYVHHDDRARLKDLLDGMSSNPANSVVTDAELRLVTALNEARHYTWSINWEPSRKAFYCVAHDITERTRLKEAKQDFVAMLSHDLRSPLTALALTIDQIINGAFQKLPDSCVKIFRLADESVVRLIKLINELLDLEKLEAGEMEMVLSPVSIPKLIRISTDSLNAMAAAKEIRIESSTDEFDVLADEQSITRVLINLLSNAIKYSKHGKPIRVSCDRKDDYVEIRVTDEGSGIEQEDLERIFERYKQAGHSSEEGTGLGLSICKAIVESHGGTIGVSSVPGQGTTFWFTLKIANSK